MHKEKCIRQKSLFFIDTVFLLWVLILRNIIEPHNIYFEIHCEEGLEILKSKFYKGRLTANFFEGSQILAETHRTLIIFCLNECDDRAPAK